MAYCTQADLEEVAGIGNVLKWADLENDRSNASIAARIASAITIAQVEVDARLTGGIYTVPFDDPSPPTLIRRVTALLALADLQLVRGVETDDDLGTTYREEGESLLRRIREGTLRLTSLTATITCPEVLSET